MRAQRMTCVVRVYALSSTINLFVISRSLADRKDKFNLGGKKRVKIMILAFKYGKKVKCG